MLLLLYKVPPRSTPTATIWYDYLMLIFASKYMYIIDFFMKIAFYQI